MAYNYFASKKFDMNMHYWRTKVCDSVFYFFTYVGLVAYIPSLYMSILDNQPTVVIANTFVYALCIFMTFKKGISYVIKAISGSIFFYLLGVFLFVQLGPKGAGGIWLFASTIIAALLIGDLGGYIAFGVVVITHLILLIFISKGVLPWQSEYNITPTMWLVQTINFGVLNFVIVIVNSVFVKGFKFMLNRVTNTRNASIIGLAKMAEYRDSNTGLHLSRLQELSIKLATELKKLPRFRNYITNAYIEDLSISSMLHDIGKVGISDAILLKPGKLTEEEFEEIKRHPRIGYGVIKEIEENIDGRSLYTMGMDIALYHHEKWDGSGYPEGLKGKDIPLSARIVALIDVYDALTDERPYKRSFTKDEAISFIQEGRGKHFDPDIVDAFVRIREEL